MATIETEFGSNGGAHVRRDRAGRNDMKRFYASLALAALVGLGGWASLLPASAAPPTVTPSPGYDARLQEQRAASTIYEPGLRYRKPVFRHRVKRIHRGAH
jgi:hypothetical protein